MENNQDRDILQTTVTEVPENGPEVQPEAHLSEVEARRAELAQTEQTVKEAQAEIESSKKKASEASKEVAEAKKMLAAQKKAVRLAERREKRQKLQDAGVLVCKTNARAAMLAGLIIQKKQEMDRQ